MSRNSPYQTNSLDPAKTPKEDILSVREFPVKKAANKKPVKGKTPRLVPIRDPQKKATPVQEWVVFDKKIATLDIETLGKGLNSVVTQISLIVTDRIPLFRSSHLGREEKWEPLEDLVGSDAEWKDYRLSVNQQVLDKGRMVEPDTLKWWKAEMEKSGEQSPLSIVFEGHNTAGESHSHPWCFYIWRQVAFYLPARHDLLAICRLNLFFQVPHS